MPMIQVWMRSGKDKAYRAAVSAGIHQAMMSVMNLPEDDYFQVTHELEKKRTISLTRTISVCRAVRTS